LKGEIKMCNCIKKIKEKGEKYLTEKIECDYKFIGTEMSGLAFMMPDMHLETTSNVEVEIKKCKKDGTLRKNSTKLKVNFFHVYCPFCGKKY
jgi:hypothetical protein